MKPLKLQILVESEETEAQRILGIPINEQEFKLYEFRFYQIDLIRPCRAGEEGEYSAVVVGGEEFATRLKIDELERRVSEWHEENRR